ncbi:MazG nucleotide pyrophosphohydrolase domain-containing protein [Actinomarinicola tropica]|uniref:MazG nucleotide pyrophosphohydrolase domain-containing protein n=1 Tax=Actinomarinicola tropica TaxID=2789776 RepID=UPI001898913E|nr:MazG nucleotide pyrophosphohydrolase domain-containing protein [Actinomarinicola tropica]
MSGRVVVVGLGPAGPDLVTRGALDLLAAASHRHLRTRRHPAASVVEGATSFDDLYDRASSMDEVYRGIVDALAAAADAHGEALYAVPGSPLVAERTVQMLLAHGRVEVEVHPALSFLDLAWVRLGVDPMAVGARVVDGHRFAVEAAGERGPLLVAQCDRPSVLSDIKLAVEDPPDDPVLVIARLGLPDEAIVEVAWEDLDRVVEPDHLTSLWIPRLAAPVAQEVARFDELVARLRVECPWDREQTHRTLARHLREEAYEVLDVLEQMPEDAGAVDAPPSGDDDLDDAYLHLEEELGDLFFQIVFHARLATEAGRFTLADVAQGIHDKLVLRHPHVFGDVDVDGDARQVERNWEQIKRDTGARQSAFDGIPADLPALSLVAKLASRARRLGVEVEADAGHDERAEPLDESSVGELLWELAVRADRAGVDAESALRAAARRHESTLREREGPTSR